MRHLFLDHFQCRDNLGDPLAGDVLKAAGLVDPCHCVLEFRCRIAADRSGHLVQRLAAFQDRVRGMGGVFDDRIQFVRRERNIVVGDIVHSQRGDFGFGDCDGPPEFLDLPQKRWLPWPSGRRLWLSAQHVLPP